MSGFMDFIGNQWLLDQYQRAADVKSRGEFLVHLVDRLESEGLTLHDAFHEVKTVLSGDAHAEAALFHVQEHRKILPL